MNFSTELLHGVRADESFGSTTVPIYQTAAYRHDTAEALGKVFAGRKPGFVYTRVGNPTASLFERRVAALERGLGAVAFSSGMAAISAAILNVVEAGDEIISSGGLFGGTQAFFNELLSFGVGVKYVTENRVESFAALVTDRTKLIYVETIGNPKLDVSDLAGLAKLAHENKLLFIVDSTVTTPCLVRPLELGADVVIHSTSKMINGGGNSLGGIVITGSRFSGKSDRFPKLAEYERFGPLSYLARLRGQMLTNFGGCAAPLNVFLTWIGLDTLALRMERACENALRLAEFLSTRKEVRVNYLGLEGNPYRSLAAEQFGNRFGTMLTLTFVDRAKAFEFINGLTLALNESNIGDARTLVIHPASTIYIHASDAEKSQAGVTEELVRVSVGIEDIDDLRRDFEQALEKI